MSIKRTRQKSFTPRRGDDAAVSFNQKQTAPEKSWEQWVEGKGDDAFVAYSMKSRFDKGALVSHSKFGKGVVIAVEEQRMEVLFADGKKKLGHNLA